MERAILPIAAGLLVVALASAVWVLNMRQRENKRLYLEYEVYKTITALTDLVRAQDLGADDIRNVIGFGLYAPDGSAIKLYGDAPASLDPMGPVTPTSRITLGPSSMTMLRAIGGDLPGRRMMMGLDRGGRMRGAVPPASPDPEAGRDRDGHVDAPMIAAPQGASQRQPALAYIELSTGEFKAEQALLSISALIITIALGALYAVLVVMYGRYLASNERESRNREIIELGQAARTIVHEIKNPLGVIRIQCGILRRGASEAVASGLAVIDDEAMRLADLAERIRSYLKSGDERLESVEASAFLEAFCARYAGVVEADIEASAAATVRIDAARVTEALDNIVANAIEASVGAERKPRIEARIRQRRLIVSVLDSGPGVPPEGKTRIFEPFYTTKERGSGLGLALARKCVESSGGAIQYSDRPGGGASFAISFPLAK